jgi:hypothetical protein
MRQWLLQEKRCGSLRLRPQLRNKMIDNDNAENVDLSDSMSVSLTACTFYL